MEKNQKESTTSSTPKPKFHSCLVSSDQPPLYEPSCAKGSKFNLYPQPPWAYPDWKVEVITVSTKVTSDGPSDDRFLVKDASNKVPYGEGGLDSPPYTGDVKTVARPDSNGDWLHYSPESREFKSCAMYATVRRVLDIFENYRGKKIEWHFADRFKQMELIPQIEWNNAQSGYGFLEFGFGGLGRQIDHSKPFCLSFDVLAHEIGHSFIFSLVGIPDDETNAVDYGGFQESMGDLTAIISSLHFKSMVDRLLKSTCGNLFSRNELSRLGELSKNAEIRSAVNDETMFTVGTEPHDRSLPLTGAIFDIFVEYFHRSLVENKFITQDLADRAFNHGVALHVDHVHSIQNEFKDAYEKNPDGFAKSLILARDYLGHLLVDIWEHLNANKLTYKKIGLALMEADLKYSGGKFQEVICACFKWRKIEMSLASSIVYRRHKVIPSL